MNILIKERLITKTLLLLPIILFGLILFLSLLEPYLEYKRCVFATGIFKTLHYICHQAPSRSIWIGNYTLGICSRCFALYLSLLITGIVIYRNSYNKILWFIGILLIIPMVIDGLMQWFELGKSNNIIRLFTGILGGIGVGIIFFPLYINIIRSLRNRSMKGGDL